MTKRKIKRTIAAITLVSVLSIWFALPTASYAKTVTVDGKPITGSLSGSSSRVTASTTYTQGSGTVKVSVTGYACGINDPALRSDVSSSGGPTSTPGSASATVNAPSGYRFFEARSTHEYSISGASGSFSDSITF